MTWGAPIVGIVIGALAALAVSPILAAWGRSLAADSAPDWWRIDRLSPMAPARWVTSTPWVTTAAIAVPLGGAAALLDPAPAWWLLGTGGAVLAVVDWRTHRLPARFVYPLAGAIVAVLTATAAADAGWPNLVRSIVASTLVVALWFLVALLSPGAVGMGDIRVAALTTGLLGWSGWPQVLL